ncbi:MAG: hypothetical protein WCL27_13300 [Betaproteobacteria bacterium]
MSVANIGTDQAVTASSFRSSVRQADQDFDQLFQSLKSGNLNAAQQAYSSFQQIQAGLTTTATPQTGTTTATSTNPVATDWSALGQALQSGNLASAKGSLSQLEQDAQTAWQAHIQQETQNAQSVYALMQSAKATTTTSALSTTAAATAQASGNSVQNDLNALNQSLQTGDTSSAQKLLAQLIQDIQASEQSSGQNSGSHHHHHHHHGGLAGTNATSAYGATAASTSTSPSASGTVATSNGGTATV